MRIYNNDQKIKICDYCYPNEAIETINNRDLCYKCLLIEYGA